MRQLDEQTLCKQIAAAQLVEVGDEVWCVCECVRGEEVEWERKSLCVQLSNHYLRGVSRSLLTIFPTHRIGAWLAGGYRAGTDSLSRSLGTVRSTV